MQQAIATTMGSTPDPLLVMMERMSAQMAAIEVRLGNVEGVATQAVVPHTPQPPPSLIRRPPPPVAQQPERPPPCIPMDSGNDYTAPQAPDAERWALCAPPVVNYSITYSAEKTLNTALKMKGLLPTLRGRDLHDATSCLQTLSEWHSLSHATQQHFAHRIQLLHIASVKGWGYAVNVDSAMAESEWELPDVARFITPAPYLAVDRFQQAAPVSRGRGRGNTTSRAMTRKK